MQRAERTSPYGAGTGITVESGHAYVLGRALKDFAAEKTFDICVAQKRRVKLNYPPLARLVHYYPVFSFYKKIFHFNGALYIRCISL